MKIIRRWLERRHKRTRTADNPSLLQLEECRRVLIRLTLEERAWDRRIILSDAAAMVKQISYRQIEEDYMAPPAVERIKEEATNG